MPDLHADITRLIQQGRSDGKRPEVVAHAILSRLDREPCGGECDLGCWTEDFTGTPCVASVGSWPLPEGTPLVKLPALDDARGGEG